MISDSYRGREQSYIKHQFLTQYLQVAAYKTLQGRSTTFNFVDAFAGPWRVSDNDYSDASFDQALRTLEAVRAHLGKTGIGGLKIRFCFCERQAEAFARLQKYAASHGRFEIHVFHGSFEDHLVDIATVCRHGFTFSFIDPTGWNVRSQPVLEFLKDQGGEFLLNFMAEHVNRHAEYSKVAASFGRFLADPDWSEEFGGLPSGWSNEQRVLNLLKRKIKKTGAATYVPDFPILKPREQRVKMRLLLGTHSAKGLEVFRNVQEKVEKQEIETRNQLRNEGQGQVSLFTDDEVAAMQQKAAGIGCPAFLREAEDRIVAKLSEVGTQTFSAIAVHVLEEVPIRLPQIKKLVNDMRDRHVLNFDLPPRKRVPQDVTTISLSDQR